MLAVKRRQIIAEKVKEKKFITVKELTEEFDVTDETIRRDLKYLEQHGELLRTHGGAFLREVKTFDVDVQYRKAKEIEAKLKIAEISKNIINDNDVIFLDSSTTAAEIAKAIRDMTLTVVTNSLLITNVLANHANIKTIVIGGTLDLTNLCFIGDSSSTELGRYFTNKCFVSCRSISLEHGPMDSNERLAMIRSAAISNSNSVYLIADHTKFGGVSLCQIAPLEKFDGIITDEQPSQQWLKAVSKSGPEFLLPSVQTSEEPKTQ
jgi:DeoR/GlpR family transcriptional regulator of sugar metabolism